MADSTQPGDNLEAKKARKAKRAEYCRKWHEQNRERVREQQRQYREQNKEAIRDRNRRYHAANKEKISKVSKAYRCKNKEAIAERRRQQYSQNSETIKQRVREYRLRDIEGYRQKHQESQKKWRAENKGKVRATYVRYMKKKRREDHLFDLKCKCRERIANALRRKGACKSARTISLIGCSAAELAAHLESLFLPGMTWENRGRHGWHIDHIIPLAKFDLTDPEQQAAAFHYTNLQPLWARDNLSKSDKVPGQLAFGFAYAARIADAASAKPKRRRKHGGQYSNH